jgi:hypothetical protein
MFGAFAAAYRRRQFSRPDEKELGAGSVQEALAKLGQIFRADMGYNPYHGQNESGIAPCLSRQLHGMKNNDPAVKPQKAPPVSVFREMHRLAKGSHLFTAMANLSTCAFFWCMRSCEYTTVSGERRTKILCLKNIVFQDKDNKIIPITSILIFTAVCVTVTFEFQKKLTREDSISQHKSGDTLNEGEMCGVLAWAKTVWRIVNYPIARDKLPDTPVNTVMVDDKLYEIPGELFVQRIRTAVSSLGREKLGFGPEEVGNHSPRSAGAMALFLGGTPVYSIMLQGRWSSDAFMRYIRKEVLQASIGLAERMLRFESFYTVPAFTYTSADGDLRTSNRTTNLNGSHDDMRRGAHPAFHLE